MGHACSVKSEGLSDVGLLCSHVSSATLPFPVTIDIRASNSNDEAVCVDDCVETAANTETLVNVLDGSGSGGNADYDPDGEYSLLLFVATYQLLITN